MKAIIIDDEINNVNFLKELLRKHCPNVEVVGFALDVTSGINCVLKNKIDILFLDIELPQNNGFTLLSRLEGKITFQIIFVTAFSSYALQAIKFSALDYLLKPVQVSELKSAVDKAKKTTLQQKRIDLLLDNINVEKENLCTLALPQIGETRYVKINEIIKCKSTNNYTTFFLKSGEEIIVSRGIFEYDAMLAPGQFIRCHRSYLINKSHVRSIKRRGDTWFAVMSDKTEVPVSRAKKVQIQIDLGTI